MIETKVRLKKIITCCSFILVVMIALSSCSKEVQHIASVEPDYYRIDKRQPSDNRELLELIEPYKSGLDATMKEVIGQVDEELRKTKPNGSLNNFVADILLAQARKNEPSVEFALQNYGGIRIPALAKGEVTVGKVYELMPFDNLLVILTADGKTVQRLFDRIADYGGWPLSKGTSFKIQNDKAVDIVINGKPFDPSGKYTFALPDYIANGGDNCTFLLETERNDLGLLVRDALIQGIRDLNGSIKFNNEIRIVE